MLVDESARGLEPTRNKESESVSDHEMGQEHGQSRSKPPAQVDTANKILASDGHKQQEQARRTTSPDRDVDSGYAWVILAAMFIINASTYGAQRAYGLIYDRLVHEGQLNHDQAARPFNVMGALENMAGPLTGHILASNRDSWRLTIFLGSLLITLAHLLAALTPNDSLEGHLLSMGVMCGLGLSFVMTSSFQINNAYFVRYRSRAFGVSLSGAAFGSLALSKLCEWVMDMYEGTSACYLVLCLLLAPNILLSALLKPKRKLTISGERQTDAEQCGGTGQGRSPERRISFLAGFKLVLREPHFHLIWPTQLLFCWFNFVLGLIMVDFCQDRGLSQLHARDFVLVWAIGQLAGRLLLSPLVDLRLISYRAFTVVCLTAISLSILVLDELKFETIGRAPGMLSLPSVPVTPDQRLLIMLVLVFVVSSFIALLYILLNGLVVSHMDPQLQPLSIGISSFLGSFFLLPRATAIGFYRDTTGNYDSMLRMFSLVALGAALTWLIVPTACRRLKRLWPSPGADAEIIVSDTR